MTWCSWAQRLAWLSLIWALAACAPGRLAPPSRVPNALSSFVVWSALPVEAGWSAQGTPVDVVHVRGGDVLRLIASSNGPVAVAERMQSESGAAEEWSSVTPTDGVIMLRATPFTTELQWSRGAIRLAYVGKGSEPGYYWFELEDRVLEWAAGPIPAPFPEIAPPARIASDAFADLDRLLAESIAASDGSRVAVDAARAIRRIAGLRAVRALRPPSGYPYFFDSTPAAHGRAPTRTKDGHLGYEIAPGAPLDLEVDGPAMLHVFVEIDAGPARENADIRVVESGRVRALTSSTLPRSRLTTNDPLVFSQAEPRTLRRAIVHVPPGRHAYRIEIAAGRATIVPLRAAPVVHIEDAGVKSEEGQLETARRACVSPGVPPLCALALALLAEDHDRARSRPGTMRWTDAMYGSSEAARRLAESFASGGPRDPIVELEARAAHGDRDALEALARVEAGSADEGTRAAWARSTYRGTTWQVAENAPGEPTWLSLEIDAEAGAACSAIVEDAWPETGSSEEELPAPSWHGAPALDLAVSAACDDPTPVELLVDGERLVASPSAGLVRWHVRVRHETARVRRLDAGRAHVFATPARLGPCGARFESIRSPRAAAESPHLAFDATALAPGVELWLRDGTRVAEIELTSHAGSPEEHALRLVATGRGGMVAYDEHGARWTRVMRAVLPAWAAEGVEVRGGPDVAVRAIDRLPERGRLARADRAQPSEPTPIDEAALASLSGEILSRPAERRGELYLRRALLLVEAGANRGAMEDAQAADALGARAADGRRAVDLVRELARPRMARLPPMAEGVDAYGVEPDFDPGATRCRAEHDGPRARFQRAYEELAAVPREPQAYDVGRAARAVHSVQESPLDPRAAGVMVRALAGSHWKLLREVEGEERTAAVARPTTPDGPIDARGELRAHVLAGDPFAQGTFATVLAGRPARANVVVGDAAGGAWLDVACIARSPSKASDARCPIEVQLDGSPVTIPEVGEDGRSRVPLPVGTRSMRRVEVDLGNRPGRWVALVRIAFERETRGSSYAEGVGWVLLPHPLERRYLVASDQAIAVETRAAGVYRVDVVPSGAKEPPPEAVLDLDGHPRSIPVDGTPVVIPVQTAGRLTVRAVRGEVSVALAERVPNDDEADEGDEAEGEPPSGVPASTPGTWREWPPVPGWREIALRSPPPLTPLESSLGTTVGALGLVYGTLHPGTPATSPDYYAFALAAYRRRIESINLWTTVELFGRTRVGAPTFGADGVLYEDLDAQHVRLSGSLGIESQQIGPKLVETLRAHAFVEYSARLTRDFFVLPRLGYDGIYTSLRNVPPTLSYVDAEVFDPYRYERPSFLFAQALFWYAPFFNDIFYLRTRATWNAYASTFSHTSVRPGGFFVFGNVDLTTYLDALWYAPSDSPIGKSRWDETVGVVAEYDRWSSLGSLCIQPGLAGYWHLQDPGWQVNVFINLFASYRRGLRDFSSLELDFPEQRSGGIPWRGSTPGGYE